MLKRCFSPLVFFHPPVAPLWIQNSRRKLLLLLQTFQRGKKKASGEVTQVGCSEGSLSLVSAHTYNVEDLSLSSSFLRLFLFSPPEVFVRAGCAPLLLVFLSSQKKKNLLLLQQQQFLAPNC